ncbi:hypothetical protein AUEXF2481DRAFT_33562 [Aureobasidium subglaciale EXF-2481]|uniref:CARD domain-containing protein n=1 Tax=Aureobasidium subglaciale (strain EXF-2481) TaxID=1043005 RepID=A0A074XZL6_AURSE|nr:uncharacterized protein AUEXF2481DRAFT_33562 [Aureobasidium subglaciale EXF-2481]KAI5205285.1 hypothetical protein E4T38_04375 [Aureobasidium subglaciale]KAI5224061.1 hypothetical protein E4T40_04151 [Aureobasidium subglaciale]KAI5228358.1 hypothetical protein E4T41_03912 [Aureobasidium subglaciale]KAI5262960.1 hypothetical protein E4T46_04119 [Aureobasidium subglaciale]KEQ90920.1 hypothetical protein AUEXF2481DRAFT_33562 [Aureobasidium subglaciale EXF-2481]
MISEIERGFNYTLTRDKLAMNLGSPPRKPKNVTPGPPPATVSQTSTTTTTTAYPATTTYKSTNPALTPFPPFESPAPTRYELSAESDNRVATLEAQVASLTQKGVEAADRLADYEEEIQNLKIAQAPRNDSALDFISAHPFPAPPASLSRNSSITSGKFSFLTRTSSLTNTTKPLPKTPPKNSPMAPVAAAPPSPAISEVQAALAKETSRRIAAEKRYKDLETELEDLSATLFEQANEMVATERKEKAKLEERLKVLEQRDVVGQKRLEMVEAALTRIERVKKLLDG